MCECVCVSSCYILNRTYSIYLFAYKFIACSNQCPQKICILLSFNLIHRQTHFFNLYIYINILSYIYSFIFIIGLCNLPPVFTEDMNNLALSEATPVGWIVYTLEGYDPEGGEITFGLVGTDNFMVNPKTGEVKVVKALDREVCSMLIIIIIIIINIILYTITCTMYISIQ